jgi:hypothetical protein
VGSVDKTNAGLRTIHRWIEQVFDPVRAVRGLMAYPRYFSDWRRYASLQRTDGLKLRHAIPQLHDRKSFTPVDPHYFYMDAWALRRLTRDRPVQHVDIGSSISFVSLLSAVVPTLFVDYRPPRVRLDGLSLIQGNLLQLPFRNRSIDSLSCLHVAEHIGLGRYGDPLEPLGTEKAAAELCRVLSPGGQLYFAVPVGKPRLCFNAHRVVTAAQVLSCFDELELQEFSAIDDSGIFYEHADCSHFDKNDYACGLFVFRRKHLLSTGITGNLRL